MPGNQRSTPACQIFLFQSESLNENSICIGEHIFGRTIHMHVTTVVSVQTCCQCIKDLVDVPATGSMYAAQCVGFTVEHVAVDVSFVNVTERHLHAVEPMHVAQLEMPGRNAPAYEMHRRGRPAIPLPLFEQKGSPSSIFVQRELLLSSSGKTCYTFGQIRTSMQSCME
jgi:hypothetical protein